MQKKQFAYTYCFCFTPRIKTSEKVSEKMFSEDKDSSSSASYWIRQLDLVPHPGLETGYLSRDVFVDEYEVINSQIK